MPKLTRKELISEILASDYVEVWEDMSKLKRNRMLTLSDVGPQEKPEYGSAIQVRAEVLEDIGIMYWDHPDIPGQGFFIQVSND